jgi:hypothetical protein
LTCQVITWVQCCVGCDHTSGSRLHANEGLSCCNIDVRSEWTN